MDLSSLTAPDVGAIDPVLPTASLASFDLAVFKQAAQGLQSATLAVRQFARSTVDLGVDLGRVSQQTRPSYGVSAGTSSIGQIGGAAKLFSAGLGALTGIDLGGPISMGLQLFGLASSIFGGKPSVGPGGGAQFGLDATGKAVMGITNADNGYDPSVNQATADAVGAAAMKFLSRLGGTFQGTVVEGWGGYLGYDAGSKKYAGGADQRGAQLFDKPEQAAEAALIGVIQNAKIAGLSKDIEDRLRAVAQPADLEALAAYVEQLHLIFDGFTGWAEPLTGVEAQVKALADSYALAKTAAESLSQPLAKVTASYQAQHEYLTREFTQPLIDRQRLAGGDSAGVALARQEREYAALRKSAAALGGEAVLQVERTIAAERDKTRRDSAVALAAGALETLQNRYTDLTEELRRAQREQIAGLTQTRDAWLQIVRGLQQYRDSLMVGGLSPLNPGDQLASAQQQFSDAVAKANGGDAEAAGQLRSLAQQALTQTQSYYGSSAAYAAYFQKVQDLLLTAQNAAQLQIDRTNQQLTALLATQQATRDTATIAREIADVLRNTKTAQTNVVTQSAGGSGAAAKAISDAYQTYLGYAPSAAQAKASGDYYASGHTLGETVATIKNVAEAQVRAVYQSAIGRDPEAWVSQYWQSTLAGGGNLDGLKAALAQTAEYKAMHPGFALGGDHGGGWRVVGERGPELEATGPARIWSFDETQRLLGSDSAAIAAALSVLAAKLDALIRIAAAAGDDNAEGLGALRAELAELRRRARLMETP